MSWEIYGGFQSEMPPDGDKKYQAGKTEELNQMEEHEDWLSLTPEIEDKAKLPAWLRRTRSVEVQVEADASARWRRGGGIRFSSRPRRRARGAAAGLEVARDGETARRRSDGGGGGGDLADGDAAARFGGGRPGPGQWRLVSRFLLQRVPGSGSAKLRVPGHFQGAAAVSLRALNLMKN
ncbi:hypothetical protein EJB05_10666, partial [Eragrostis curvula]